MVPVEQKCPTCGEWFMGSDMVGFPCFECGGMNQTDIDKILEHLKKEQEELENG